jgi:ribonuclease HII
MDNVFDSLYYGKGEFIAGIDESGVSDIAGPLVAACVILPKITSDFDDFSIFKVNDSKKILEKYRKEHAEVVLNTAIAIGIGETQPSEIDYLGKRKSTILAMMRAVSACRTIAGQPVIPNFILVDGEITLPTQIPYLAIKDGDTKSLCVASASIIAKVYRDDVMLKLHQRFPQYAWNKNKGYPCENQYKGMDHHGIQIGIHRTKFWPFTPGNKEKAEDKSWYARRGLWRQKTVEALIKELT